MQRLSHALRAVIAAAVTFLGVTPLCAQTVRGRVLDASSGQPLASVRVVLTRMDGSRVAQSTTDPTGLFIFTAAEAGEYRLSASHVAYQTANSDALFLGVAEEAVVEMKLATTPIPLDPLTVVARRADHRHEATYDGLYARFRLFPSIGNRRVVLPHDPEMTYSANAYEVLAWISPIRRREACPIVYWNGNVQQTEDMAIFRMTLPASLLEGVEYYRSINDAPFAYRDIPSYLQECTSFSVVALWARTGEYVAETVPRYLPEPAPWHPRANLVGYRVNGANAPGIGVGVEVASHQELSSRMQLGVFLRGSAHQLSANATQAMTSTLSDLTYRLPAGNRGFQFWALGMDAKVIPVQRPTMRVTTSARIQVAQRRFSLRPAAIGAGDIGVTSYGWGYGVTAGTEFRAGRRIIGTVGIGQDWFRFRKYEEIERSYNPTAANWSATALRLGIVYSFARE